MVYLTAEALGRHMGYLEGLDAAQTLRAEELIEEGTGLIERETGPLLQSLDTVTLDGTGRPKLLLPRWPVNSVTSVTEIDADGAETLLAYRDDYTWSASGILTRMGCWPGHDRAVRVLYIPGYATLPADVRRILKRLCAAGWENPAGNESEARGDRNIKFGSRGMALTTAEKDELAAYGVRR